jgi:hypothetical protein
MIHANTRVRLTADDFSFVVRVLSKSESDAVSLVELLTDEDTRDAILDHEALAAAVLNSPERLPISPEFLFYVLCRKVLRETPAKSREVSDYVAALLAGFLRSVGREGMDAQGRHHLRYLSDIMQALNTAGTREAFLLRVEIANHALFISGIFAGNVEKRTQRMGAPDLSYYEAMGRMNYRAAAEYREAGKFRLQPIFEELADSFREVRLALNDLATRLLHLESHPMPRIAL